MCNKTGMSHDVLFLCFFLKHFLKQIWNSCFTSGTPQTIICMIHFQQGGDCLRIYDFTADEIQKIKKKANFTKQENELFDLRNNQISLVSCAEYLNCSLSTVNRINRHMLDKINKVR